MGEQRREQDIDKDRQSFLTLLGQVKTKLEAAPADSASTKP